MTSVINRVRFPRTLRSAPSFVRPRTQTVVPIPDCDCCDQIDRMKKEKEQRAERTKMLIVSLTAGGALFKAGSELSELLQKLLS